MEKGLWFQIQLLFVDASLFNSGISHPMKLTQFLKIGTISNRNS